MTKMTLKIHVTKTPLKAPMRRYPNAGDRYPISCNGERIGIYFAKMEYLELANIPKCLMALKDLVKKEVEKVLKVKVQYITSDGIITDREP